PPLPHLPPSPTRRSSDLLPTPREEKRPDSAKFVSEHDSSVERETKKYGRFEDQARQGDASGTASTSQPAIPKGDGRLAMRTPDLDRKSTRLNSSHEWISY